MKKSGYNVPHTQVRGEPMQSPEASASRAWPGLPAGRLHHGEGAAQAWRGRGSGKPSDYPEAGCIAMESGG